MSEATLPTLASRQPVAARIEEFWSAAANRGGASWLEHADSNGVMLGASLVPEGYLGTD